MSLIQFIIFPRQATTVIALLLFTGFLASHATATDLSRAGYAAAGSCATCHAGHAESYQHVGMSQSFRAAGNAINIERFGEIFHHQPSDRYYSVVNVDEQLTFQRFQKDQAGNRVNEINLPIDWILGSGNRTRSYLYQNDFGEIFQLPIGWYAEAGGFWEMSPGFETADHDGISRKVTRECLFCHNAFPGDSGANARPSPPGAASSGNSHGDRYGDIEIFPHQLPEGTGCQRCHGPGQQHIELATTSNSLTTIREAITNPAKLEKDERDSVCLQCHLQPSVSIFGPRKFGRADYSFRPGELLSDYLVHLDMGEQGIAEEERFEINHHGYRFLKSECYQRSEDFTCISCHNPHIKPESHQFRQQVAGVCQDCHENPTHKTAIKDDDCVTCHMPTRRTRDVVHVTMTDHWIARGPHEHKQLTKPRLKELRPVTDLEVLAFGELPDTLDQQAYRAIGAMRAGRSVSDASRGLLTVLQRRDYDDYTPYLDLAKSQLQLGNYRFTESAAKGLLQGEPELYVALNLLGTAQLGQRKTQQAIRSFKQSLSIQADPEVHFNLAAAYLGSGQLALAEAQLDEAIALRPQLAAAWLMKGRIFERNGAVVKAINAYQTTLGIDPGHTQAYQLLIEILTQRGERDQAANLRELASRAARNPQGFAQ